jgi:hypothetical protein
MNPDQWEIIWRVTSTILPVLAGLSGVLIGAHISDRNQKKRWIIDHKQDEYKTLLTALSEAFNTTVMWVGPGIVRGPDQERMISSAESQLSVAIRDRIFIVAEVYRLRLSERWSEARTVYERTWDLHQFCSAFAKIYLDIQNSANHVIDEQRRTVA